MQIYVEEKIILSNNTSCIQKKSMCLKSDKNLEKCSRSEVAIFFEAAKILIDFLCRFFVDFF